MGFFEGEGGGLKQVFSPFLQDMYKKLWGLSSLLSCPC